MDRIRFQVILTILVLILTEPIIFVNIAVSFCLHLSTAYFKKLYYLLITLSKTLSKLYFGGVT